MSKALVIRSYDELSSLIHKSAETVVVRTRVEPETEEEKAMDGQLAILTSLTLHHFDKETGVVELLQVQVKDLDENGEETNGGRTHCSFGGDLDSSDVLVEGSVVDENGDVSYELTLDQFLASIPSQAVKVAEQHLGVKLDLNISPENVVVFQTGKDSAGVAKLVVSSLIGITAEQMKSLSDCQTFDKEVINKVGAAGISVGEILVSFNLEKTIDQVCGSLTEQHGMDPLSVTNARLIIQSSINEVLAPITYKNLIDAVTLSRVAVELDEAAEKALA